MCYDSEFQNTSITKIGGISFTNLLMILLIPLILKLAVEILVVMLLTLLILSLKVKKMKN